MNIIEQFLEDFRQHYLSQNFQYGNNVYLGCLEDLRQYSHVYMDSIDCDNIQVEGIISDISNLDDFKDKFGIVLSYQLHNNIINRPRFIKKVNNKWYIGGDYMPIKIFDDNWSYLGDISARYASSSNGYYREYDMDIDFNNDIIYIACYNDHIVQAFRFSTGDYLFTIGTFRSAGDVSQGRLYYPRQVKVLSNGHVLVLSQRGRGLKDGQAATAYYGHISEYDGTGNFINTKIQYEGTGNAWSGECYYPNYMKVYENEDDVFVCYYDRGYVARFDLDFNYKTVYTAPSEMSDVIERATPKALLVDYDSNQLIVANESPDLVASVGLDSHDLNWYVGRTVWNDTRQQVNMIGAFYSIEDIIFYDDNKDSILVVDRGNNCLQVVPSYPKLPIEYNINIPNGYKIVDEQAQQFNYNVNNNVIEYSLDELCKIKEKIFVPLEKSN